MGAEVRQDLGVESATAAELAKGKSSMTSDLTALRLYAEGIDKLHTSTPWERATCWSRR